MLLLAVHRWLRTFFAGRTLAIVGLAFCAATASAQTKPVTDSACPALLRYQFPRLQDDSPQNLCQYSGRVLLVVNTASFCGYTSQYEGLEALYAKYAKRGLVVLGFLSNDFGKQEPGSSKEIADFCFNTYGVKFPMFAKTVVTGSGKSPFYTALATATGATPQWNFHKFLIDRNGKVLANYTSDVEPQSPKLLAAIEQALR